MLNRFLALFLALVAIPALADTTSGPINPLPKIDIVETNGTANRFSNDPQIATMIPDATGVTAATTAFTVFKDGTHLTPLAIRGALIANSTQGTVTIARSGLYRARYYCSALGTTADVSTFDLATTVDDISYSEIASSVMVVDHLTGILTVPVSGEGYFNVSTSTALAGTLHLVWRGKNSAHTTTCAGGGGLIVERVDQSQPAAYP